MTTTLKRTTIFLTGDQHDKLRCLASEKRASMARLIRDAAIEILEDEEDTIEGLKVLADNKATITWKEYQKARRVKFTGIPTPAPPPLSALPRQPPYPSC